MNDDQRHSQSFFIPRVPPENVLDLRVRSKADEQPSRKRKFSKPLWQPRTLQRKPNRALPAVRTWFLAFFQDTQTTLQQYRIGLFSLLAATLLVFVGLGELYGQAAQVRQRVESLAQTGYSSFSVAAARAASRDFTAAAQSFQSAEESFSEAGQTFNRLNPILASLLSNLPVVRGKVMSVQHLTAAARLLSAAGERFSRLASSELVNVGETVPLQQDQKGFSTAASLIESLKHNQGEVNALRADIDRALIEITVVRTADVPAQFRESVKQVQELAPGLRQSLAAVNDGTAVLADIFGVDAPSEYLFVFQNANELRPTGGFIGSFALVRIDRGRFQILDGPKRGSLGVDDYLPDTVEPPVPLQVITPSWYFRDANWYPDFPASAEQLVHFYREARGFSPRGVIAFTHHFLERLLEVVGPITVPEYNVTIDSQNFSEVTQEQTERKYDLRVNDPKKFIVDLIPILAERLSRLEFSKYPSLLAAIAGSVQSGDFQMWSSDPVLEESITTIGSSGSIPQTSGDFLELVDANIGGGKTDGVISTEIIDSVSVKKDGTVTSTVAVTRTHHGSPGEEFTSGRNRSYHRLYVPRGSKLLSAQGFTTLSPDVFQALANGSSPDPTLSNIQGRVSIDEESGTRINDEFGKTVFGNWTELDPGERTTFSISYQLPFKLEGELERYVLFIGKQAGAKNRSITVEVEASMNSKIVWVSPSTAKITDSKTVFHAALDRPQAFSLVIKR